MTWSGKTGLLWLIPMGCLALGLCGCTGFSGWLHNNFKVGPNYRQPAAPVSEKWIDEDDPNLRPGNANIAAWWDVFGDPILTQLIYDASAQNLTVRQVGLQILQSRIQRGIASSELLPQAKMRSRELATVR